MIVMKFGGTSVKNAEWIDNALDIAFSQIKEGPVLIASAMGKATDRLQEIADLAEKGNKAGALELIDALKQTHINTAETFAANPPENTKDSNFGKSILHEYKEIIENIFGELTSIVTGLSLLKEKTPRSNDLLLSFGERLSTLLISYRSVQRDTETILLDSRDFMKTDDNFTNASIIEGLTNRLIKETVKPAKDRIIIAQGFIASTEQGTTTTLGRGGSDYTATIIGSALDAKEVQIWTDVDGIMTSDPRMISDAATISSVSYREAAELAYFGARVIHPSTIQPAVAKGIPVCVKNTKNPNGEGTKIISNSPSDGPKAIAFKKDITVISISSGRMLLAHGFLKGIFEIFEKYKTSVDLVATSEVSVSITIDNTTNLDSIENELKLLGTVTIENKKSIVCLVGQDLWKDPEIIANVFSSLKSIPIRMISLGSSDTNLSLVVPQDKTEDTVIRLHKVFFED